MVYSDLNGLFSLHITSVSIVAVVVIFVIILLSLLLFFGNCFFFLVSYFDFCGCRCFCCFNFVFLVVYFGDTFSFAVFNYVVFIEQCLA